LWLNLQKNYDLWLAYHKSTDWQKVKTIQSCEAQEAQTD
jgi:plasmid maintenance system antidote protein VapI